MMPPLETLGLLIRITRVVRGLTQERAAKNARVSRRQWALLEKGENVSVVFLLKVAESLGLTFIPVKGTVRLGLDGSGGIDLDQLLRLADEFETMVERLRACTIEALLPPSVSDDAAAIDDFLANLGPLTPETAARVEHTLGRGASDVLARQPQLPRVSVEAKRPRRRRQA